MRFTFDDEAFELKTTSAGSSDLKDSGENIVVGEYHIPPQFTLLYLYKSTNTDTARDLVCRDLVRRRKQMEVHHKLYVYEALRY